MKKSELIAKLQAIPGDPEVAILDLLKNAYLDEGEGAYEGIYNEIGIEVINTIELPADHPAVIDGMLPWLALTFKNEEYENQDEDLDILRTCRICGCTDRDCRQCIEKTGSPCSWVAEDLCSACV